MAELEKTRGHKKRAKTRARILDAGLEVYVAHGAALTVQRVVEKADVSHGTFYNYFDDLDALTEAVVLHVLTQVAEAVAAEGAEDPALRFATATLKVLHVLAAQPDWARLTLRITANPDFDIEVLTQHLRFDVEDGRRSGRFSETTDDVSVELVMGLTLMSIRRISRGTWSPEHGQRVVARALIHFGLDPDEAHSIVAAAAQRVPPTSS
ncbi:MAG: TetR/AcrR family transcriptional regulator [Myxococcota bacterium]